MATELSPRAQQLMKVLVENYLRNGVPIGSKTLAQISELSVSSATIRNIMGELEHSGFVQSPHTSAGRVPTAQGYRLFVDNLLTVKQLEETTIQQLQTELSPQKPAIELISSTSHLLSELTHMAGLVRVPNRQVNRIRQIEFMPLTETNILAILVLDEQDVQNRVIKVEQPISREELLRASAFVNEHLAGKELSHARDELLGKMRSEKAQLDSLMQTAIKLAEQSLQHENDDKGYHLSGDSNLLNFAVDGELGDLKAIFDAFRQKQEILNLLDKVIKADGVQIFIGEESETDGFQGCSIVTAPYQIEDAPVGVLAVVGPTRMRYDKVVPIVDITAKLLSSALNHSD
ncbi:heat-inducible transcriptional repressor HrcA [Pleionea sp. CnH1-48]|uniref:heat-inducible transcriptional repressor HrcA n=1 Tax=Pleionea sp. CnH1-48 TaxID=2954494 RepID=UPI002097CAD8|nr:heat-inducible transcriptional repressor HrcA [Pleionea sp. CnH1-48]MCO7224617.1 heat-inducible transcriptional repressor HrcA [Pleionea sp. CnH1-48]